MRRLHRGDVTLMLLGSSEKLDYRKRLRRKLLRMGYHEIIIMESVKEKSRKDLEYDSLDEKFAWIIREKRPKLIIAIFHKETKDNGIIFEIGWLCGKFGSRRIIDKLRLLFEEGYDLKSEQVTAYISSLFS